MLPREALSGQSTLERVRSLCSWVCTRWPIQTANEGVVYTPWETQTIFSWGSKGKGHNGLTPIAYCVHYAVALTSCCAAAGIPARSAAVTDLISGDGGHFVTEVWFDDLGKWVMVDPTVDAILVRDGLPMSIKDIQEAAPNLADFFQWGPGYDFQLQQPYIKFLLEDRVLNGLCFRHRSVWPRADFLSRLELAPPAHGWAAYSETDLVWEQPDLEKGFGMFPYFGDADYFDGPPQGFPGG
jgi:hypothetical protein